MLSWRWRVLVLVCLQVVFCIQCVDARRHHRRHRRHRQQYDYDRRYNRVDDVPTTTTKPPDTELREGM